MTTVHESTVTILTSGDPGWDGARQAWNLAVDQHPAAIALPRSAEDVVAAVRFARDHGLRLLRIRSSHPIPPAR